MLQRYTTAKEIGAGWLGRTHLALQHGHGGVRRLAAIKEIHANNRVEPLFHRCRLIAPIEHHNLNRIHELGFGHDRPLIAADYVVGETLLAILARAIREQRPVPVPLAVRIAADACAGLHAAHTASDGAAVILHCDLHPANLMISYDGCVKVVDAGLLDVERLRDRMDISAAQAQFLAPELLSSADAPTVRVDVYSAAVLLYVMLTLRYPNDAHRSVADVIENKRRTAAVPPSARIKGVPPELEQLILQGLSVQPGRRQASAEALRYALENFLARRGQATTLEVSTYMATLFGSRVRAKQKALAALLALPPGGVVEENTIVDLTPGTDEQQAVDGLLKDGHSHADESWDEEELGPPTLPDSGTWTGRRILVSDMYDDDTETDLGVITDDDDTTLK